MTVPPLKLRVQWLAESFDYDHGCFPNVNDARTCQRLLRDPMAFVETPAGFRNMPKEEQATHTEFRVWLKQQDRYFWPMDAEQLTAELLGVNKPRYGTPSHSGKHTGKTND